MYLPAHPFAPEHLVVERQLGRDRLDQGYLPARRRRSRREEDAALPGLEAGDPGLFDED